MGCMIGCDQGERVRVPQFKCLPDPLIVSFLTNLPVKIRQQVRAYLLLFRSDTSLRKILRSPDVVGTSTAVAPDDTRDHAADGSAGTAPEDYASG